LLVPQTKSDFHVTMGDFNFPALLIVVGVDSWRNLILRRAWGLTVLVFLALVGLDYWALTRWIVPNLAV
jgi:hypothetical protein